VWNNAQSRARVNQKIVAGKVVFQKNQTGICRKRHCRGHVDLVAHLAVAARWAF